MYMTGLCSLPHRNNSAEFLRTLCKLILLFQLLLPDAFLLCRGKTLTCNVCVRATSTRSVHELALCIRDTQVLRERGREGKWEEERESESVVKSQSCAACRSESERLSHSTSNCSEATATHSSVPHTHTHTHLVPFSIRDFWSLTHTLSHPV